LQGRLVEMRQSVVDFDGYVRYKLARDALHIAHDHPAFGTGPGTFVFVHPRYQDQSFSFKAELTHDDYLNCLADYGLVGFAIAMFFVFAVTLSLWRRLGSDKRWRDRVIVAAGLGAWTSLCIHSLFDFNLHIPANPMILFAMTGLALRAAAPGESPRHWSTLSLSWLGRGTGVIVVVLSVAFGLETARSAASDIAYEQALADAEIDPSTRAIRETQAALDWDPGNAQALTLLGDIYRYRASREKEMADRISEGTLAMAAYQKAIKANPLDDTIEARLGLTFDIMHRFPEAYFCYQQALAERPFDGQFWTSLGNHFWMRGMLFRAEESYHMAARCPRGGEVGASSAAEVGRLLDAAGVPQPPADQNPFEPERPVEHPPTLP
jgi:tetratricopeptide (TPR) repeat protein